MNDAAGAVCPQCQTTNPTGAKFCSSCATSLSGGAPPRRGMPTFNRRNETGRSFTKTKDFIGTPTELFDRAMAILETFAQKHDIEIYSQIPGQQILSTSTAKALFIRIKSNSEIYFQSLGNNSTRIKTIGSLDSKSIMMMGVQSSIFVLLIVIIGLMFIADPFTRLYFFSGFGLLFFITMLGINLFFICYIYPNFMLESATKKFFKLLEDSEGQQAGLVTPPRNDPATKQENGEDMMDRIKKLAELRDAGAITPEEFETKKAELLSKI